MATYPLNDLAFSMDGDFRLGPGGDLSDLILLEQTDVLAFAKQSIAHRLMAERNGWSMYPQTCAGLEQFLGQIISPDLIGKIERQVHYTLTHDGLFHGSSVTVKALDLGQGTEAIALAIYVRGISDKPVFVMAFDIQNGHISQVL